MTIKHACIFNSKSLYCATTSTLYIQECILSNLEQHIRAEKVTYYRDFLKNVLPRLFIKLKTCLHYREYIIPIYHVWEGYLQTDISCLGNCSSLDWYFSQIPLPNMIDLFNYTEYYLEHWLNK
jgi:hypothetical protein